MKTRSCNARGIFIIKAQHAILKEGISIGQSQTIAKHDSDFETA